MVIGYLKRCCH